MSMIKKISEWRPKIEYCTGVLGILIFLAVYGCKVLNPAYIGFFGGGGDDIWQHYLGWCFYRNSEWQFPIGLMDNCIYPSSVSIIYTDSIPLFAVIFKLLSPILPDTFQYFGIWGIFSYFMTGFIGGRILKKFLYSNYQILISSVFLILTPVCLRRMFGHTALAGIWILLLGFFMYFNMDEEESGRRKWKSYFCWSAIGALCASVHMYFLPMLGIVLLGYCIKDIMLTRKWGKAICTCLAYAVTSLFVLYLLGAFTLLDKGGDWTTAGLLGQASMNLNTFINPLGGWSGILPEQSVYAEGQREGFAYLGVGMIIMFAFSIVLTLSKMVKNRKNITYKNIINADSISCTVMIICSVLIALSPIASINDKVLYSLNLPGWTEKIWSIFYATGRFIWILMFLIIIYSIRSGVRLGQKYYMLLLMICLGIQLFDLSEKLVSLHDTYTSERKIESSFSGDNLKQIIRTGEYNHLVIVSRDIYNNWEGLRDIACVAVDHSFTTNYFRITRFSKDKCYEETIERMNTSLNEDTIYIFLADEISDEYSWNLHYYELNDTYTIGTVNELELDMVKNKSFP